MLWHHHVCLLVGKILTVCLASVTRLGNLLHFGQLFKAYGNNYFAQIAHILGNFWRCQNISVFKCDHFWATFYRHLATFYNWSRCHCVWLTLIEWWHYRVVKIFLGGTSLKDEISLSHRVRITSKLIVFRPRQSFTLGIFSANSYMEIITTWKKSIALWIACKFNKKLGRLKSNLLNGEVIW